MNDVPSHWSSVPIGTLCTLQNGRAFKPSEWSEIGLPIVRIQNLNNPDAPYNRYQGPYDSRHHLVGGELLFAWSGTPGTSFGAHVWQGGEALLNQHIFRVDFDESLIDKRFFRFAINQKLAELIGIAHGGVGLRHVTKGKFEATEVLLPPLTEQRRIADKLDALLARVDACRDRLDRVPRVLKRFRQAVLAAAVEGRLLGLNTTAWSSTTLGDIVLDMRYGTSKRCTYDAEGTTPVLRIPNISNGRINTNDIKYASFEPAELSTLTLRAGDILVIRSNGSVELVGRAALVDESAAGYCYAGYLIRLRVDSELIVPQYLQLVLSAPKTRNAIELNARSTSGVHNINTVELRSVPVSLPPIEEQMAILDRANYLINASERLDFRCSLLLEGISRISSRVLSQAVRG